MEQERRTSTVELFWDLVFVFAVTQVTTLLRHDLSWAGFGRSMLLLSLVWWAWSAFVWVTNAHDPDRPAVRASLLGAAGLIFLAGLAVPHAYGSEGTLFAITYGIVRLIHLGLYADAARGGSASSSAIAGFAGTACIGVALLLAGSVLHGDARIGLWTAAAAIDYGGPVISRRRLRGLQHVAVEHFAERYGLFIIICLGESVVGIGFGAEGRVLDTRLIASAALALLITAELWWTYFAGFAATAQERLAAMSEPVLTAVDGYSYLHLPLVAGIIVFAVGARDTVARTAGALGGPARLALCAGVALYLLGGVAFRLRVMGDPDWAKLTAVLGCMAVYALCAGAAPWVPAAALAVLVAAMLRWEHRHPPAEA
jgi:low temperature requirement protein LtrA